MSHDEIPPVPPDFPSPRQALSSGWKYLARGMAVVGILFMVLAAVTLSMFTCIVGLFSSGLLSAGAEGYLGVLLFLGWAVVPAVVGGVLIRGSERLANRAHESGTFLVVAAAALFAGLAWVGVTAALLLREAR
jgi:hypothetical protein